MTLKDATALRKRLEAKNKKRYAVSRTQRFYRSPNVTSYYVQRKGSPSA